MLVVNNRDMSRTLRHGAELTRTLSGGKHSGLYNGLITAQQLLGAYREGVALWRDKTRWTITVCSDDHLYDVAHSWFAEGAMSATPPRAVNARLTRSSARDWEASLTPRRRGEPESLVNVELYWDENRERTVMIDGHRIAVSLQKSESWGGGSEQSYRPSEPDVLHFHARSHEAQVAVIDMLRSLAQKQEKRRPALYMMSSWGDWARRDDLPERPADSVVLTTGQMERIQADMKRFLDAEASYVSRGIPYHRGYMLYGPPGTGKTSVVRALAAHFGMDLWYGQLGDLSKDSSLISVVNQVGPRSILLLEDVDVFHAAKSRDDDGEGLSMAGLLNALDGVATPHGLITFLTTNDIDVIDEALLRPGRVDLREHVGLPDPDQIARLYRHWYGVDMPDDDVARLNFTGSTAEVAEIFKRHMDDPDGGLQQLLSGAADIIEAYRKEACAPLTSISKLPRRPRPRRVTD